MSWCNLPGRYAPEGLRRVHPPSHSSCMHYFPHLSYCGWIWVLLVDLLGPEAQQLVPPPSSRRVLPRLTPIPVITPSATSPSAGQCRTSRPTELSDTDISRLNSRCPVSVDMGTSVVFPLTYATVIVSYLPPRRGHIFVKNVHISGGKPERGVDIFYIQHYPEGTSTRGAARKNTTHYLTHTTHTWTNHNFYGQL